MTEEKYNVEQQNGHGRIEYTDDHGRALICFTRTETEQGFGINFWWGGHYQATLKPEESILMYGNEGVDLRIEIPEELTERIQELVAAYE